MTEAKTNETRAKPSDIARSHGMGEGMLSELPSEGLIRRIMVLQRKEPN